MTKKLTGLKREVVEQDLGLIAAYKDMINTRGWQVFSKWLQNQYDQCMKQALSKRSFDPYKRTLSLSMAGIYKEILDKPNAIVAREQELFDLLDGKTPID